MEPLEPIPESVEADRLYGPFDYEDQDLLDRLVALGAEIRGIAPECVGVSMTVAEHGITFTLVASDSRPALLDAVQYLDGGPCDSATTTDTVEHYREDDAAGTARWPAFAAAATANGVASTLSLPIIRDAVQVAGFNLYGSTTTTFDGVRDDVADLLGAWSGDAISDRDLAFATLTIARRAPELLRDETRLAMASALLSRARGIGVDEAMMRLRRSALRAAVPVADLVDSMIDVLSHWLPVTGGLGDPPTE